ncbi:MAG TPA: S-methyl-5'-thioinosine phosphorylase [Chromatiaceae bacterium]|nr:S-methyl-5'-thioinosine phosphorylase [Chromatiaceae bacterium]
MTDRIAIVGGSGLAWLEELEIERQKIVVTPYGEPSAPLAFGHFAGIPVVFLPRHGGEHTIPPHRVNYRANIWALESVGVKRIISVASVGGISMEPGILCVPDQIIDYTWGRDHTFVECCETTPIKHVDFSQPYCEELRHILIKAGRNASVRIKTEGTYGATQGPRLESAAEIQRMHRDGCDLVGMTGMPEAALARELDLCFAHLSLVVNWAAGLGKGPITAHEIQKNLDASIELVKSLLKNLELSQA